MVLPLHLEASSRTGFGIVDPTRRRLLYEIVLQEAGGSEDLPAWLERDMLISVSPQLFLPRSIRAAWEQHHSVLRGRDANLDVPHPR